MWNILECGGSGREKKGKEGKKKKKKEKRRVCVWRRKKEGIKKRKEGNMDEKK